MAVREMKDSGVEWIGEVPVTWGIAPAKRVFENTKRIVGHHCDKFERLALTMNGVIKRNKLDNEGLQPEKFETYQILLKDQLVFKLIDLENVKTSRVGLSPYDGIVSPAYIVLKTDKSDPKFYLYWYLFMYYECIFNQLGTDGVRKSLSATDLLNLPIPLLSRIEQTAIVNFLDAKCAEIDSLTADIEKQIETLQEYKKSIITEAVTKGLDPNVEMKDSGVEWIGQIPSTWQVKRLKQILLSKLQYGASESGEENLDGLKLRYIRITDIDADGSLKDESVLFLPLSVAQSYIVGDGDILFARSGGTVGKTYYHRGDECCFAGYLIKCSLDRTTCDPRFFYYFTKTNSYDNWKELTFSQATIQNISAEKLANLNLPTPERNEQERISNFLDAKCAEIDATIVEKQKQLEVLAQYKQSLIYEYVTGKKAVPM